MKNTHTCTQNINFFAGNAKTCRFLVGYRFSHFSFLSVTTTIIIIIIVTSKEKDVHCQFSTFRYTFFSSLVISTFLFIITIIIISFWKCRLWLTYVVWCVVSCDARLAHFCRLWLHKSIDKTTFSSDGVISHRHVFIISLSRVILHFVLIWAFITSWEHFGLRGVFSRPCALARPL